MGKKRNILLDTINNSYDLGQVLSTYALYKTLEELGYDCVVNDRYLDEKSFGYQYLKERCCMVAGMNLRMTREEYYSTFYAFITGASNRWRLCKDAWRLSRSAVLRP